MVHIRLPPGHHRHLSICSTVVQSVCPGVEEIGVKCPYLQGDRMFVVGICRTSLTSKLFLKGSKEVKKLLSPYLPTGYVTGYRTTTGRLWPTIFKVPISRLWILYDKLAGKQLAKDADVEQAVTP